MLDYILPCLYSLIACAAFCIVYNLRGKVIFFSSFGGALGWLVYLLFHFLQNDVTQSFLAVVVISVYAEIMSRIFKMPVTVFLVVGILPLVPGSGIYYTMEYSINGDGAAFLNAGLHTLSIAGAIALGIALVSSSVRLIYKISARRKCVRG